MMSDTNPLPDPFALPMNNLDYIYLNPCDNGLELFDGVQNHIAYYNQKKHQTIKKTPNEAYQEL